VSAATLCNFCCALAYADDIVGYFLHSANAMRRMLLCCDCYASD